MTTPVPDPTKLTTDAVNAAVDISRRELASARELLETRLLAMDKATELLAATVGKVPSDTDKAVVALRDLLGARIDGMDTATTLLAAQVNTIPSETDKRISALREILDGEIRLVQEVAQEKFTAIEGTFASNALALTAALAAQKEAAAEQNKSNSLAISKSETATKETIGANATQNAAAQASQAREVADLKERLVRLEERGLVTTSAHSEQRADAGHEVTTSYYSRSLMIAGFSGFIAVVAIILTIVLHH